MLTTWKLSLLGNTWIKGKWENEITDYAENKEMAISLLENFWDVEKATLKGNFLPKVTSSINGECNACVCFSLRLLQIHATPCSPRFFPARLPLTPSVPRHFLASLNSYCLETLTYISPLREEMKAPCSCVCSIYYKRVKADLNGARGRMLDWRYAPPQTSVLCPPQTHDSPPSPLSHLSWFLHGEVLQGMASYSLAIKRGHGPCHRRHYAEEPRVSTGGKGETAHSMQRPDWSGRFWLLQRPQTLPGYVELVPSEADFGPQELGDREGPSG